MVERTASDRLFIALWPADATRSAVLDHALRWRWPPAARLTPPERLHLTLHFIGSLPRSRMDELVAGLAGVRLDPCEATLDQAEVWRGGIAVIAASQVPVELARLHEVLGRRLLAMGLAPEDRPLRVHTTVARKAQGAVPPGDVPRITWTAHEGFALVRSLPGGKGYETVQRFG